MLLYATSEHFNMPVTYLVTEFEYIYIATRVNFKVTATSGGACSRLDANIINSDIATESGALNAYNNNYKNNNNYNNTYFNNYMY